MAAPRKYPDEVRERAVRLVRDLVEDPDDPVTVAGACRRVGDQLGINTDTLRNWVKQVLVDDGQRPGGEHGGAVPDRRLGAGEPRAAPGERAPEDGLGFLRVNAILRRSGGVRSFLCCPE